MKSTFPRLVRRWLDAGMDLLFPPHCAGCGRLGVEWCEACDQTIVKLRERLCYCCGGPLAGSSFCASCERQPLPLNARSHALYQGPLVRALLHLKYRPNRRLAAIMAGWLKEVYTQAQWRADLVVAVPLSSSRLRQRGYNQSELIALALANSLALPYEKDALSRIRETTSQVGLGPKDRWENVAGAFCGRPGLVGDRAVLIVDDLYTTGATLVACAQSLKAAGARQIMGLTVGRARHHEQHST